MANQTQTKQASAFIPGFETAYEQVREAGDKFVDASRKISGAYLDGVEKYAGGVVELQRKAGEKIEFEPIADFFNAQAKLTEELTAAGITAARDLIAA